MLVENLFFSLMERLNGIEQEWSNGDQDQENLRKKILELRKVSDEILDRWLIFEERIAKFSQMITTEGTTQEAGYEEQSILGEIETMSNEVAEKIISDVKKMNQPPTSSSQVVSLLSGDAVHSFRRGQGYYSLLMYGQAAEQFHKVVEQEPDLDIARMFLGFSQMFAGDLPEAAKQFHLISQTSDHKLIMSTSLNAEGCIWAVQGRYEQALHLFEKSWEIYPRLKDPLFNKALILTMMGHYQEAKSCWLEYTQTEAEDWEALLQLARCYQEVGDGHASVEVLEKIIYACQDQEVLIEAGKRFEDSRQFGNAAVCYRLLLNEDPTSAIGWHGLGWNLWHAEGHEISMNYIKKAISLSPNHPDYQFSYGWILYQMSNWDEAEKVFQHILDQEGHYPLAIAGIIHVYIVKEQWEMAKYYCQQLIDDEHTQSQALGHLQLGRLWLVKGNLEWAEMEFMTSVEMIPEMKDSFLFLGLIWYTLGQKEKALEAWEHTLS
ncbi:MAG TPA: hypothetical protein VJ824_11835 [Bacillota bacterium]|nr:hypothetical protein [Bacillota bacterium]